MRGQLLGALYAPASNYWPRPAVIIPITSRTEESVTQRAGQGEGKATEQPINISFTHPHPLPSLAILDTPPPPSVSSPPHPTLDQIPWWKEGREGGRKKESEAEKKRNKVH